MPEPITIAAGVLALVGHCVKGLNVIHEYSSEFQRSELNVRLLTTECRTLAVMLRRLDKVYAYKAQAVQGEHGHPSGNIDDQEDIRDVLAECDELLTMLLAELKPFIQLADSSEPNKMTIRAKISVTWNRKKIQEQRQSIQFQVQMIIGLLVAIQHQPMMQFGALTPEFQGLFRQLKSFGKFLRAVSEGERGPLYPEARPRDGLGTTTSTATESTTGSSSSPSASKPSRPRLSQLFKKSTKKDETETSSSSKTPNPVATGTSESPSVRLADPVHELITGDGGHGQATAADIRDARNKFYKALALDREISAMKFVDKRYKGVLEEKAVRRDAIINELQETCRLWAVRVKFEGREEGEIVRELDSVLLPRLISNLEKMPGTESTM